MTAEGLVGGNEDSRLAVVPWLLRVLGFRVVWGLGSRVQGLGSF